MKKTISLWQTAGFLFTAILGTFLHFLFEISGENFLAALFSAVNESIWEHMKLLFYPMFIFALLQYRFLQNAHPNFWCVKLTGILFGLALIPLIYYTYTGILGKSANWFHVTIFFIAAGASFWLESSLFQKPYGCRIPPWVAFCLLCAISVLFTLLTFFPPEIPFFEDPITGSYGFKEHSRSVNIFSGKLSATVFLQNA